VKYRTKNLGGIMKLLGIVLLFITMTVSSYSRNTTLMLPIHSTLKKGRAEGVIDRRIRLQFGNRGLRRGQRKYTASRKTNAFNKTDRMACEWAFLSSVKSLQDRARKQGKRSVSGIVSYHKRRTRSSSSRFECHVGRIVSSVTLRGNI
jgi:hypothetical protein